ncbi:hypothetical protein ACVWV0_002951 [Ewingella americana]
MSIADLKNILTPPNMPKETSDGKKWPVIDEGVFFSKDYIDFIDAYGTGRIADFIDLFNPFTKKTDLNFFEQKN